MTACTNADRRELLEQEAEQIADEVGLYDLTFPESIALTALLRPARARVSGAHSPRISKYDLVRRVKNAMVAVPPEDLADDELRAVVAVIEAAANRGAVDLVGNLIDFATRHP
jgi:hypothetical protein